MDTQVDEDVLTAEQYVAMVATLDGATLSSPVCATEAEARDSLELLIKSNEDLFPVSEQPTRAGWGIERQNVEVTTRDGEQYARQTDHTVVQSGIAVVSVSPEEHSVQVAFDDLGTEFVFTSVWGPAAGVEQSERAADVSRSVNMAREAARRNAVERSIGNERAIRPPA